MLNSLLAGTPIRKTLTDTFPGTSFSSNWTLTGGVMTCNNGQLNSVSGYPNLAFTGRTWSNNHFCQVVAGSNRPNGNWPAFGVRGAELCWWGSGLNVFGNLYPYPIRNSYNYYSGAIAINDVLYMSVVGSLYTIRLNGVQILQYTDTTSPTGGGPFIALNGNGGAQGDVCRGPWFGGNL